MEYKIEDHSISYRDPVKVEVLDSVTQVVLQETPLTLKFSLHNDLDSKGYLQLKIPMSIKDIITTNELTDAQKFLLADPDVYIASGDSAETKLTAGTDYKLAKCEPQIWNKWIKTFTISFLLDNDVVAVPSDPSQGYVSIKFAKWQNAVSTHI